MARSVTLNTIDWESVEAILLDMDGTLLDLSFDNHFWNQAVPAFYAEEKGVSLEFAHQYLKTCYKQHQGTLNWYCTDFWSETLGIDIIRYKRRLSNKVNLRPGTRDFLEQVSAAKQKVFMVTNAHPETLRLKLKQTKIESYFDELYSSHQFKHPKESPLFWARLEKSIAIPLSRCLFVDDTESILIRAQESGVKYIAMIDQPDMNEPAKENLSLPSINRLTDLFESIK